MLHPQCCSAPEADHIRGLTLAVAAQCSETHNWFKAVPKFQKGGVICGFKSVPEGFSLVRKAAGQKPDWGPRVERALQELLPVMREHSAAPAPGNGEAAPASAPEREDSAAPAASPALAPATSPAPAPDEEDSAAPATGQTQDSEGGPTSQGLPGVGADKPASSHQGAGNGGVTTVGAPMVGVPTVGVENGGVTTVDVDVTTGATVAAEGGKGSACGPCPLSVDEEEEEEIFHGIAGASMLQARQARQLAPTCIRLVKELLASDRGKTD
eukprot:gene9608-7521_t